MRPEASGTLPKLAGCKNEYSTQSKHPRHIGRHLHFSRLIFFHSFEHCSKNRTRKTTMAVDQVVFRF